MVLLVVLAARAATLPECPAVATPEEAYLARDDRGVGDLWQALKDEAEAYASGACVTTSTETAEDGTLTETCVRADGIVVTKSVYDAVAYWEDGWGGTSSTSYRIQTLDAARPEGGEWTRIAVREESAWHGGDYAYTSDYTAEVAWTGAPLGLAPDGSLGWSISSSGDSWTAYRRESAAVNGCAWSWEFASEPLSETFSDADTDVLIWHEWSCETTRPVAYVNDVRHGRVDALWRLVEADADGFSVEDGDCDDADPSIYPCAPEVELDGIDQDCDGEDAPATDGDGSTADDDLDADGDSGTTDDDLSPADSDARDEDPPLPARGCGPGAPLTGLGALLALAAARRRETGVRN